MKIVLLIYLIGIICWYIYESISVRLYLKETNKLRVIPLEVDNIKVLRDSIIWPLILITCIIDNYMEED